MATTIRDVARRAQVSTATVSRVLAGIGQVRPETRDRVLDAARAMDYRPSGIARSLKLRQTRTLGLIVTDIENPFFPELVRAVEDAAREAGYAVLLCNAADDPEREAAYLDLLFERRVDGVVIAASSLGTRHKEWLAEPPLPVILVNAVEGPPLPTVASDSRGGARLAVEHLLSLGHRRIAHLAAPPRNPDGSERLEGARAGIAGAGLDPATMLVVVDDAGVAGGERAMREVLVRDRSVTGVFAYNDLMAIGALRAIRATGRSVPRDISVVGFDDIALSAYVDPPLTTIAQETAAMGRWAVGRLIASLASPGSRPPSERMPVSLRVRGSTGPAPARARARRVTASS